MSWTRCRDKDDFVSLLTYNDLFSVFFPWNRCNLTLSCLLFVCSASRPQQPDDQPLHRDYGNHSLVVPRSDGYQRQFTTFILLSDVTSEDGPTKAVPLEHTKDIPMHVRMIKNPNPLYEKEVDVVGPAGTLLIYHTAVFHRGSKFTAHPRHRFAMLCDYMVRGPRHQGKMSWPNTGNDPAWTDLLGTLNARQRDLVGFPRTTDRYWNDESLRETEKRFNVKLDDVRAELEKRKARLQARAKQGRL